MSESELTVGGGASGVGISEAGTRIDGSGTAAAPGAVVVVVEPDAAFALPLPLSAAAVAPAPVLPGGAGMVTTDRWVGAVVVVVDAGGGS